MTVHPPGVTLPPGTIDRMMLRYGFATYYPLAEELQATIELYHSAAETHTDREIGPDSRTVLDVLKKVRQRAHKSFTELSKIIEALPQDDKVNLEGLWMNKRLAMKATIEAELTGEEIQLRTADNRWKMLYPALATIWQDGTGTKPVVLDWTDDEEATGFHGFLLEAGALVMGRQEKPGTVKRRWDRFRQ